MYGLWRNRAILRVLALLLMRAMRLSSNLATREDLNGVRTALELKLGHMESKFDAKLDHMESKFDSKFGHMETKFEANLNSLGALLRAEIRVTRVMIAFLRLIVLGTWGVLALPLLTSVRLA
jgi:hypothetical protein